MKKHIKILFIILIQCIFIIDINAVEDGKVYNITKSSASSAFGFENYDKHTASDGSNTVNAYCVDRGRSAPTTAKVTRVLGSDKNFAKYDNAIITILKEEENGVDYESIFLALRIFVNTIDQSGDGNGGVDPTYQKELEAILNCFLTDSSFKEVYTSYTGKSPKVGACKSPVKGEGNNKLGTVKEILKKGLEAGVNENIAEGQNTVEKGPTSDVIKENGMVSKVVSVKANLAGIAKNTDFFKYMGYEAENSNLQIELLGYSKTFISSKDGWNKITESSDGFDLSKIDGEEAYNGDVYIGFLIQMESQDDGSGNVDDEDVTCENVKINVKFKYNGKDLAALLSNGSGLQAFYAYIPETGDPIDLNFELYADLCDEANCDPNSTLPNICEDGLEPDKETGNVEYEFREAYNAESGKYNIKKCLLSKNSKDKAGNPYKLIDDEYAGMVAENDYCEVKCKEDYIFGVPYKKNTESGRYFQISVSLKGEQDCYTTKFDYKKYTEDIVKKQAEIIDTYNEWLENYENYTFTLVEGDAVKCNANSCSSDCSAVPLNPKDHKKKIEHSKDFYSYEINEGQDEWTITVEIGATVEDPQFGEWGDNTKCIKDGSSCKVDGKCEWKDGKTPDQDYASKKDGYKTAIETAKKTLKDKMRELREIIDKYNSCAADHDYPNLQLAVDPNMGLERDDANKKAYWDMVYRYSPNIQYSYEEPEPGISSTRWISSVQSESCEHGMNCDFMYSPDGVIVGDSNAIAAMVESGKCVQVSSLDDIKNTPNLSQKPYCMASDSIQDIDDDSHLATWYCDGDIDTEYELCNGSEASSPIEYSDEYHWTVLDEDLDKGVEEKITIGNNLNNSKHIITKVDYVHKIASSGGTYKTERVYYTGHDDGNIEIEKTPEHEKENYDIVDGLPVGINTPTGIYYYKLALNNFGTFYSAVSNNGRIYGTLQNSLSTRIRGTATSKNDDQIGTNEYACTYEVNQNVCVDSAGNKHYKSECKENEDWDKCQKRICRATSGGPYCVEKAEQYYKCSNTYYDESCEKVGSGTREETLLAVGCQPGEVCEHNYSCCPNCKTVCVGICTIIPPGGGENKPNYDFRPVSPGNLFPNDREVGFNWERNGTVYNNSLVARKAGDTIDEITTRAKTTTTEETPSTSGTPKVGDYSLKVVMNSDMITKIREYNKSQESYNNDTMTCYDYPIDRDETGCKKAGYTWKKEGTSGKCVMANIFCYSSFVDELVNGDFGGEVDIKNGEERIKAKENFNATKTNYTAPGVNNNDNLIQTNDYWTIYIFSSLDVNNDGIPDVGPSWK